METIEWGVLRDGSDALASVQNDARQRALTHPFPSTESETWRYSPIAALDVDAFRPVAAASGAVSDAAASSAVPDAAGFGAVPDAAGFGAVPDAVLASVPDHSALVVLCNGALVSFEDTTGSVSTGQGATGALESAVSFDPELFDILNIGYVAEPVRVEVAAGVTINDPIVIVHYVDISGGAVPSRVKVTVGADAEVRLLEMVVATGTSLVLPHFEVTVGDAARVGYQFLGDCGNDVWMIGRHGSSVGGQATYNAHFASFGGRYCRQAVGCHLAGRGATGNLAAVTFGTGEEVMDYRTFQFHEAADAMSDLLFKGVVDDKSRSIYTGMIRVGPDASGTNAFQTNRNIKLSDEAWAESVPNLEIETNDVRCSHASTVGPIDEGQRFYLESHGVPTAEAERLIVAGFFSEVIDASPVPGIGDLVTEKVRQRLEGTAR